SPVGLGQRLRRDCAAAPTPALPHIGVPGQHRVFAETAQERYGGMCVLRLGYSSLTRASTALLEECCRFFMQYCSSNHSIPSISVVPRISTVSLVSLFTAVR